MMGDFVNDSRRVNGTNPYAPLKEAFERIHGPAIGPDFEFALRSFGFTPDKIGPDSFARALERSASRFAGDFIKWITHGQRPLTPVSTALVSRAQAARAVFTTLHRTMFDFVDIMCDTHATIISVIKETDRQAAVPTTQHVSTSENRFSALHDRIRAAILAYNARTDSVRDAPEAVIFSEAQHSIASSFMNSGAIWLFFDSMQNGRMEKINHYFDEWCSAFVDSIINTCRTQAALRLNELDHTVFMPLAATIADASSPDNAAALPPAQEFVATLSDDNKHWQRIFSKIRKMPRIMPEHQAEVSFVHHAMNGWYGYINGDLQNIVHDLKKLSTSSTTEPQSANQIRKTIDTCITRIRESHGAAEADIDGTPALDFVRRHFAHRGATLFVTGDEHLPSSIDQRALRKALTLLVMNAMDFPRNGVPLEIGVRIERDRIMVADNGRGMTPERLAEVRTAEPVQSDHGGTGLGLYYLRKTWLPQLFPEHEASPSLAIASQPGIGSTFTICYNFAKLPA